jgi:CubicO group peptidase (beta-lactamase class C family)
VVLGEIGLGSDVTNAKTIEINGHCALPFGHLRDVFVRNFNELGEIGASYAIMKDGELVVDLWGGFKDEARTTPWERDTIVGIWSAGKSIPSVCFAMLRERGLISYDDKVCTYWPEFAANGKEDLTIGMLLSHQSGITGFTTPAVMADFYAGGAAEARLAAQAPLWKPGTAFGYQGMVIGIITTGLFRRIEGRSVKQFTEEELRGSYGIDISVGLRSSDRSRCSDVIGAENVNPNQIPSDNDARRGLNNPPMDPALPNDPAFRAADLTSGNGFANARGLASLYGLLMHEGANGKRLIEDQTFAEMSACRADGIDVVRGVHTRWAAGYLLNTDSHPWGPNRDAFGTGGWGGSFGYADPTRGIAVAYAMNHMSDQMDRNPRRRNLIDNIYQD